MPEVQHVHIADTPLTSSANQHTVYSFHSQSLYEGEIDQNPDTTEVGVVELRPLTSTSSADANLRLDYALGCWYIFGHKLLFNISCLVV